MALDKVIDSATLDADLTSIADAIRAKKGVNNVSLDFPVDFVGAIESIEDKNDYLAAVCNFTATEIINNKITQIPSGFQEGSAALTKVSMPKLTTIPSNAFNGCSALIKIDFPNVTTIESAAFHSAAIQQAYFPELTTFAGWFYAFYNCRSVTKIVLPKLTSSFGDATFNNCRSLETLVLGSDTFCALTASNVFNGTPMVGHGGKIGYIYVKKALIDTYKTASNWSALSAQFRAIEDYPSVLEGLE